MAMLIVLLLVQIARGKGVCRYNFLMQAGDVASRYDALLLRRVACNCLLAMALLLLLLRG